MGPADRHVVHPAQPDDAEDEGRHCPGAGRRPTPGPAGRGRPQLVGLEALVDQLLHRLLHVLELEARGPSTASGALPGRHRRPAAGRSDGRQVAGPWPSPCAGSR